MQLKPRGASPGKSGAEMPFIQRQCGSNAEPSRKIDRSGESNVESPMSIQLTRPDQLADGLKEKSSRIDSLNQQLFA